MSLSSLSPSLTKLISTLPNSFDQSQLDQLVKQTLEDTQNISSPENRKSQWEYLLRNKVFELASTEGTALKNPKPDALDTYYTHLRTLLDITLTFTEHQSTSGIDPSFPFQILQDLLETQTISSCSHIFTWIESRKDRLTQGMIPQKGKALILLRTLNDLLRRLSKMGMGMTGFCGRILCFLSGVFPLGERSGVNLRGEYGPVWEGAHIEYEGGEEMQVDEEKVNKGAKTATTAAQKTDLYNTFWSLQLYFSKPSHFASHPSAFAEFKVAISKILPVLKEANAKERLMMGSKAAVPAPGSKRKREREQDEDEGEATEEYFFAKFLTSPELLDLEIADTHFRRQILLQLLILLSHLLTFTKSTKATWVTPRNRSLHMDFTLSDDTGEVQWVQETYNKALEELRQTSALGCSGRTFAETAQAILERDRNWVKWKNELCAPFDKEPWGVEVDVEEEEAEEATKDARVKMRESPEEWPWKYGSEPLTEIWEMGYMDLDDLQRPFHPGDIKDFMKKIDLENRRIEMRTKTLRQQMERREAQAAALKAKAAAAAEAEAETKSSVDTLTPTPSSSQNQTQSSASPLHPSLPAKPSTEPASGDVKPAKEAPPKESSVSPAPAPVPAPLPPDDQIMRSEESKQRWAWLALRTARDMHLSHFGKIGTGDVGLLVQEIEKEKEAKEKEDKGLVENAQSPSPTKSPAPAPVDVDPQADVKMEVVA
ncbi:udp-glucose epimerase [Moniliophthora roreri MCA 2997]|uniref:Udp-glucose epimerase n=1 Tax=Moniliophthora roreri (strain MCA 2997) TaxID=1381753 RepID=V2XLN6_MONRO|nr:udp-glucose epimerase [Moniliophthora roreri MCA 2997]